MEPSVDLSNVPDVEIRKEWGRRTGRRNKGRSTVAQNLARANNARTKAPDSDQTRRAKSEGAKRMWERRRAEQEAQEQTE
jgi:hypothetical protein